MKKTKKRKDLDGLKKIEEIRKEVNSKNFSGSSGFGVSHLDFSDFEGWANAAENVTDPDKARNILYYGFQPLYDALISDRNLDGQRMLAIEAIERITESGVKFLTSYYLGKPDVKLVNELGRDLKGHMASLKDSQFTPKFRNVDYNGIYPSGIAKFLEHFLDYILSEKIFIPQEVVGCACGSSEVVMPMVGITDSNLSFMRRSWRRGDDMPKIIPEQRDALQKRISGKNTICVEDYVCSGRSLRKVIDEVEYMGAKQVLGLSVNGENPETTLLKKGISVRKFQSYTKP